MKRLWMIGIWIVLTAFGQAAVDVTAKLSSTDVVLGQDAYLYLTISGSRKIQSIHTPNPANLQIRHRGESSRMQWINGVTSTEVTHTYVLTPLKSGVMNIPPFELVVDGQSFTTQPATLNVRPPALGSSAPSAPSSNLQNQTPPAPSQNVEGESELAFLRMKVPKTEAYVGEKIPVQIQAFFLSQTPLMSQQIPFPTLHSEAFTVGDFAERPSHSQTSINGKSYSVFTWNTTLSAVKAGRYPLQSQMECAVLIDQQPTRGQRGGFGLLEEFFNIQEPRILQLQTDIAQINILPLPEQGRPENFSGAVGQFAIRTQVDPPSATVGDPMTVKTIVAGAGNFDRMEPPQLASETNLRTYPPSSEFERDETDASGLQGRKIFEQAVIPESAQLTQIPPVQLTYFDPRVKQYRTASSKPIPVQIKPAPGGTRISSTPPARLPAKPQPRSQTREDGQLVSNAVQMGRLTELKPVLYQPWFLLLQAVLLGTLMTFTVLVQKRERLERNPQRRRAEQTRRAVREQIAQMENAERNRDAITFFMAARRALQERLAGDWNQQPESITAADINTRLPEAFRMRQIFEKADALSYAGGSGAGEDLASWREIVLDELQKLESNK